MIRYVTKAHHEGITLKEVNIHITMHTRIMRTLAMIMPSMPPRRHNSSTTDKYINSKIINELANIVF